MQTPTRSLLARLTIAFAIVLAVLAAQTASSAFHNATLRSPAMIADVDDHEGDRRHSRDVEQASDEAATSSPHDGDHHRHNPGDHSHDKLGTPPAFAALSVVGVASRLIASRDQKVRGLSPSFLRPPRQSDIA